MPTKKQPAIEFKEWGQWRIAWVSRHNFDECCDLLRTKQIAGFGVSPHHGSDFEDLSAFVHVRGLNALVLPFCQELNLAHLGSIVHLRLVVVGEAKIAVDLSDLALLSDLTVDWLPKLIFPNSATQLKRLRIGKFKPKSAGVSEINRFLRLETLELVQADIASLEGVEDFAELKTVDLHYMPKLESIKHISETPVEQITITHCKKVTDLDSVARCKRLQILRYHDSAPLPSIGFVNDCPNLKEFRFVGVDVIDGDLTPLKRLDQFAFTQKKHFSHTEKALRTLEK